MYNRLFFTAVCDSSWLPSSHPKNEKVIDCGEPEALLNGGVTFISGTENRYGSVIQYHCNAPYYSLPEGDNGTYTCAADGKWKDHRYDTFIPTCIPGLVQSFTTTAFKGHRGKLQCTVCGQPTVLITGIQRILGGAEAPAFTLPWQVMLSVAGAKGGGIVIGDRWVMTAAHSLVQNGRPVEKEFLWVFMGDNDAENYSRIRPAPVASLHVHPGYNNPNHLEYNNDIALIELQHSITFNKSVMPICLPTKDITYKTGQMGLVSGFGITDDDIMSNKLRHIHIPIVDQEMCKNSIYELKKKIHGIPDLTNNMFCAGLPEGGKDPCAGDAGGVFSLRNSSHFWAAGIVSWGIECGVPGRYGIYTRVANYLDWIKKNMAIDCGEPEPLLNGGVTFISGTENQHGSVIQYHCNAPYYSLPEGDNVRSKCAADGQWRGYRNATSLPTCIPVCGQPTVLIAGYQRIIGGGEAPAYTVPWQVMLSVRGRAGGMLIGDRWIMTAAHNLVKNSHGELQPKEAVRVFMGGNDVNMITKISPAPVASLHVHPEYNNPNDTDYNNDIALIKLEHPVTFNASVMPICLPVRRKDERFESGQMGLISGFGLKTNDHIANSLMYVRLPLVDQVKCNDSMNELKRKRFAVPDLTDNMFCAGNPEGGKDACQGDSGSAYARWEDSRFWAIGIISWGIECGEPGRYGVFVSVVNYLDWINKTMHEN